MNSIKTFTLLLIICLTTSCSTSETTEVIDNGTTEIIECVTTDISVSEADNVVTPHATNPVVWEGTFNDDTVTISFTTPVGSDGETETKAFIFNKKDDCLTKNRAYEYYNGESVDVSAVTEMDISEFYIKEWVVDEKLTGFVVYTDPHDKITYSKKFYVEFTADDFQVEFTNFLLFEDCMLDKLPAEIDMNSDGIVDFKLTYDEVNDVGNRPRYNQYTIKLTSTFEDQNKILSPVKNQEPYFIVHEPPFTSENKTQYINGVKDALDVFYEYDAPYQNFNYFLNNNLTYSSTLKNNKDDYFIISMTLNNEVYYGWIKFSVNTQNCEASIIDTFLSSIANEHVSVN
ncbi:hypothetical protein [Polaribacter dokdonensis]|uniref:Lipoprotein n=1 Tax=Polaribacter dokdonensis DSW-5 TaxID=1300348 RepID=A0A0M9CIC2_9FLAO|nr:hypothetical protein [Polaribacter dokdonensis]KOY53036.1 hypothetical protein I602_2596 [Polaribacter dokdonensis DSW-5]SEE56250.1 hypothetical protein SAMN05444353_2370 [Polaribacter dokdonensis DSW-5]